jgi:hypothetical protein
MLLVQGDDVIEQFAASTADPALSDPVLPGAPSSRANGSNATCLQELENLVTEFGVAVEEDVPVASYREAAERRAAVARSNRSSDVL